MARFMLLLHDNPSAFAQMTPAEMQACIERYMQWSAEMRRRGVLRGGEKLRDGEGRLLKKAGGKLQVTDGPYAESREVIGGYFELEAADYNAAIELAQTCPHVDFGTVEIREIEVMAQDASGATAAA